MDEARRDNPQAEYTIRPTDNGIKDGDLITPQTAAPLELDGDGLPVGFEGWAVYDGNR